MPSVPRSAALQHIYREQRPVFERVLEGDPEAWAILVRDYAPLVYGTALRAGLPPDEAADVAQTVWLALLEGSAGIRDSVALPRWLAVTARRIAVKRLREFLAPKIPLSEDLECKDPTAEELLAEEARVARVRKALDTLPEHCRVLLATLFGTEKPSYEVISEQLGIPVGSIGPMRARCLAKLYRRLARADLIPPGRPKKPGEETQ